MIYTALQYIYSYLEMDDFAIQPVGQGSARSTFTTSGLHPGLVKLKAKYFGVIGAPIQRVTDVNVTEVQRGPIGKRYEVTATVTPLMSREQPPPDVPSSPEPPQSSFLSWLR